VWITLLVLGLNFLVWLQETQENAEKAIAEVTRDGPPLYLSELIETSNETLLQSLAGYSLGEAVLVRNLAIVPILSDREGEEAGAYLTLEDALERHLIAIGELEGGARVPFIAVHSQSDAPVFLPFGGVITGGSQDRMICEDVLLQPRQSRKIAVYCIERGRWSAADTSEVFTLGRSLGSLMLKSMASDGSDQSVIWEHITRVNGQFSNASISDNFQGNFETVAYQEHANQLQPAQRSVALHQDACGAVVLLNGEVQAVEIYGSPTYFKTLWPRLFAGYVIDAYLLSVTGTGTAPLAASAAQDYLSLIGSAEITQEKTGAETKLKLETSRHVGHAILDSDRGRLIYLGFFPKTGRRR
jgi:hypothetical protein